MSQICSYNFYKRYISKQKLHVRYFVFYCCNILPTFKSLHEKLMRKKHKTLKKSVNKHKIQ